MDEKNKESENPSFGVEALIQRLCDEGVVEGRVQAEHILNEATSQAEKIIKQAKDEAKIILAQARDEAEQLKNAGTDGLKLAYRDTLLKIKQTLRNRFSEDVKRLVGKTMKQEPFIKELILQIAGQTSEDFGLNSDEKVTIKIPKDIIGLEDLRQHPEEYEEGTLSHFVLSIMESLLQKGVSFEIASDFSSGLQVKMDNNDILIDFTDQAMANALLMHLNPRFRALLEGVVK